MELFSEINGKKFRKGYTTGSCAAAASKAAVLMLLTGRPVDAVEIDTPAGIRLKLAVSDITLSGGIAGCCVVKDGGDDPDITTGLKIFAQVRLLDEPVIQIKAGEGIGKVTFPGLKAEVGQPAINPVPMAMIRKEVGEVLPSGMGAAIILSVPGGEEAAKKTYNPRLGIIGGISILGTSGIVEPMSEEAWKDSLAVELNIAASRGFKEAAFVFGNYGEDFAVSSLKIDRARIIKISNFVGFMLDKAAGCGFEKILIIGHLGKLVKLSAGIFNTHSRTADARLEILAAYAALEGASRESVERIYSCRTTDAAAAVIDSLKLGGVYKRIVDNVSNRCKQYTFGKIEFGTVLFNGIDTLLTQDGNAEQLAACMRSKA
ncbi:MAG: cobalt-precorrin-5B (C(1))-methyltransferase CbiD [Clostridia bacterium]|nr:cobalt-precorrin-5B (C(1))-methyltransferase CbiD [Clostridia bacterium]